MKYTSALPIARVTLRGLVIANWVYGAIVLAILVGAFTAAHWTLTALGFAPDAEPGSLVPAMRWIAGFGLVSAFLNYVVLTRLLAMVNTVAGSDPFVAANAARLQTIAWAVLGQQLLQLVIGTIASTISTPAHPLHIGRFSTAGWLAVILLFVLARVFVEGTRMREDLEGTV